MRTRSAAAPSASRPGRPRGAGGQDRAAAGPHAPLRQGLGLPATDGEALLAALLEVAPKSPGLRAAGLAGAGQAQAPESASCSRARKAPSSTSTTALSLCHLIPTPSPARPRRGSGMGPRGRAMCWASSRLHDAGRRGPLRLRTERRGRRPLGDGRPRGRRQHRPAAPLRLVRCGAGAPVGGHQRHRRHRPHQAGRARRA